MLPIVRFIGLTLVVAGWGLSLYFMFQAGHQNPSALLMACFAGWVSLPFMVLLILERNTSSWTLPAHLFLYALMEAVAILSVVAYSGLVHFEGRPTAFVFLVVPGFSLVLIAIVSLALRRMQNPES